MNKSLLALTALCCLAPATLAQTKASATQAPLNKGYSSHAAGSMAVVASTGADNCANASTTDQIAGYGTFAVNNTAATSGAPLGSCGAMGNDVWFRWTAPASGTATVSTCGGVTGDSVIAVWADAGPGLCPTTQLVCLDDSCGLQSTVTISTTAGTNYMIEIGGFAGATFSGTFAIAAGPTPPVNDNCATPIAINGPGVYPFDNRLATTGAEGQTDPLCLAFSTTAIHKDSWWTYTPTASGTVTVSTCAQVLGGTDTRIAVWDGTGCPTAAAIACNDDNSACTAQTLSSLVTFNAVCGQTYTIQLGNFSAAASLFGTFTLTESGTACGPAGVAYCFGDGTGIDCAASGAGCANGAAGNGCANSVNAAGGNLTTSGNASISADTLALLGSGMPNSSALYFQGTAQIAAVFGDGIRCAGGTVTRLGTKTNVAGASQYPEVGDQSVSVRGVVTAAGNRAYQVWYRNAAAFCTPSTFNLTNGMWVTWTP